MYGPMQNVTNPDSGLIRGALTAQNKLKQNSNFMAGELRDFYMFLTYFKTIMLNYLQI